MKREVSKIMKDVAALYENKTVAIGEDKITVPSTWSDRAARILLTNYCQIDEDSIYQVIGRILDELYPYFEPYKGLFINSNYLPSVDEYFVSEYSFFFNLAKMLVNQEYAFNTPVWTNFGTGKSDFTPLMDKSDKDKPQGSACFILDIEDDMYSILKMQVVEGMIFKQGSGAGANLSNLRASNEELSTGGYASGPCKFLKGYDTWASIIKSGGKVRRAARMSVLDIDHPDIEEFITLKRDEEDKLRILSESKDIDSDDVFYQNTNLSVRISDKFMEAVESDSNWLLKFRGKEKTPIKIKAKKLWNLICKCAWESGDPGLQFSSTINKWNPTDEEIVSSNPCSEFYFVGNSACNLSSINAKYFTCDINNEEFKDTIKRIAIAIVAQDLLIDASGYPTAEISYNSKKYRPIGLGLSNIAASALSKGHSYGSPQMLRMVQMQVSLLTGVASLVSFAIANKKELGPCPAAEEISGKVKEIIKLHTKASPNHIELWEEVKTKSKGLIRNAQTSLIAPTGTISLLMDCETMGIEPPIDLVTVKKLVNGGSLNLSVLNSLRQGIAVYYNKEDTELYINKILKGDYSSVPANIKDLTKTALGENPVSADEHLSVVAVAQPLLSGGISKTVNVPLNCTVNDVSEVYMNAWKKGLKGVTVYRDNSKVLQLVHSTTGLKKTQPKLKRHRLPVKREATIQEITIGGEKIHLVMGRYSNGKLGELFIHSSKLGSVINGYNTTIGRLISLALQYGVSPKNIANQMLFHQFDPQGFTNDPDIKSARSIVDYVGQKLLGADDKNNDDKITQGPSQSCEICGSLMRPSGDSRCYLCHECGFSTGCS